MHGHYQHSHGHGVLPDNLGPPCPHALSISIIVSCPSSPVSRLQQSAAMRQSKTHLSH